MNYFLEVVKYFSSHGHFYTIPTKSEIVADGQDGLWLTEFKGGKDGTDWVNSIKNYCFSEPVDLRG